MDSLYAVHFDEWKGKCPLSIEQMDVLCEKINMPETPKVLIDISEGLLQAFYATEPMEVRAIDMDLDGVDKDKIVPLDFGDGHKDEYVVYGDWFDAEVSSEIIDTIYKQIDASGRFDFGGHDE